MSEVPGIIWNVANRRKVDDPVQYQSYRKERVMSPIAKAPSNDQAPAIDTALPGNSAHFSRLAAEPGPASLPRAPEEVLAALDPEQQEVATSLTGPMVVLAGAGTGKTRAITHRIAYGALTGVYRPASVLAVTFTARAAGEMRTRLRALGVPGVQAKTFHAAALKQLSYFWPQVIGGTPGQIVEHKGQLIGEAARTIGLTVDKVAVRDLASEIEWAKVSMITPEDYESHALAIGREPPAGYSHEQVAKLAAAYESIKELNSRLDFEDIILLLGAIIAEHRDVANQVRNQYRHFIVDEYQDVSPLQQFLLDQWLGDRKELCVVGDPAQTIYSFTGASPHYLLEFRKRYREAKLVKLERDYRSTPQVVHLANDLLKKGNVAAPLELRAVTASGPPIAFQVYDDDTAEAVGIAQRAADLIRAGVRASEIAVLYRTNVQAAAFETAFAAAGIGYSVRGSERYFQRKEIREAMVLLRAAARSSVPDLSLPDQVRDVVSALGWTPNPPAAQGAVRERWDALNALVNLAIEAVGTPSLAEFVADLGERASAQHAPTLDGVTLASLHAAKGLEWDAVFLAGLSDGLVPISLAGTEAAIAEERRLLYVGVTRARRYLQLSYARARGGSGRASRKRTRFLDGIWPPETKPGDDRDSGRQTSADRRNRRGAARAAAHAAGDGAMFDALGKWRRSRAEELGRPAFTVLPDVVLADLAHRRPVSIGELAGIRGIGPVKIEQFGAEILAVLSATVAEGADQDAQDAA